MDEMSWPDTIPSPGATLDLGGVQAACLAPGHAVLVSGNLGAALAELAPGARMVGLGGDIGGGAFALRIARDRALLVAPTPFEIADGWQAADYGVSRAGDAFCPISLVGERAGQVIAQGTACDLKGNSPSAALIFAGQFALLARDGAAFMLWVERPMLAYVWDWIGQAGKD
ncbi:hypothetical protein H0I76_10160 [Limibaculum sp. M0105]|uniref:Uncharacterized protein n=1 Tax=Thermohalobaculum xanthum TaxID=2753746 RepID=A0A8J7SEK0_9RHOB|nr:hypothetical protein [Thermohalobaculum xanthum]MBK0399556.1 hypothetical protein [Thermohalobaculum xanthum]